MRSRLRALLRAGLVTAAFAAAPVYAGPLVYTLNVDYCGEGCLYGETGGTVTLEQIATGDLADVRVTVNLIGVAFHDKGLMSFAWNLDDAISGVTLGPLPTGFATGDPSKLDGAGDFDFAINCDDCGPSAQGMFVTSIAFDVMAAGLTTDSFNFLSSGGDPSAYFAATVFNTTNTKCTGVIGADGGDTFETGGSNDDTGDCSSTSPRPPMPEPQSLALAGIGLIALGVIRRRRTH